MMSLICSMCSAACSGMGAGPYELSLSVSRYATEPLKWVMSSCVFAPTVVLEKPS